MLSDCLIWLEDRKDRSLMFVTSRLQQVYCPEVKLKTHHKPICPQACRRGPSSGLQGRGNQGCLQTLPDRQTTDTVNEYLLLKFWWRLFLCSYVNGSDDEWPVGLRRKTRLWQCRVASKYPLIICSVLESQPNVSSSAVSQDNGRSMNWTVSVSLLSNARANILWLPSGQVDVYSYRPTVWMRAYSAVICTLKHRNYRVE